MYEKVKKSHMLLGDNIPWDNELEEADDEEGGGACEDASHEVQVKVLRNSELGMENKCFCFIDARDCFATDGCCIDDPVYPGSDFNDPKVWKPVNMFTGMIY